MSTGSDLSPSSGQGRERQPRGTSTAKPATRVTDLLTREGAPWRPFNDDGVLLPAKKTPRSAKQIFADCEKRLTEHLVSVCLWPEKSRDQSWRIGDYAFYALHFDAAPKTSVYVQVWSEPDEDGALHYEVSSGHYDEGIDRYLTAERQERIRAHGFEIGETAKNFLKCVAVHNARHVRALAREFITVLCDALGYDGTQELTYRLHLGTISRPAFVFDSLGADDLAKLMRRWGFAAELKPREEGKPRIIESRTDHGPFIAMLADPSDKHWRTFKRLQLRTYRTVPDAEQRLAIANHLSGKVPLLQAHIDEDGDLVLETAVLLEGGVTAEHLRARFEYWRAVLGTLGEGGGGGGPPRA